MASGLFGLRASIPKLISCVEHSIYHPGLQAPGWRTVMSIAFNTENEFPNALPEKEIYHSPTKSLDAPSLKEREKGDWKSLTLDEKRTLYNMSFSQPLTEVTTSSDEWKPILAGTFAAMGLMTMGIYVWLTQSVYSGPCNGSLSHGERPSELLEIDLGENLNSVLDCRH